MTDDLAARRAALAARRTAAPARRTHAAIGGRILAAGLSTGGALLLTGFMARAPHPTTAAPAAATAPAPFLEQLSTGTVPIAPSGAPPATAPATPARTGPLAAAAPAHLPPATTSRAS